MGGGPGDGLVAGLGHLLLVGVGLPAQRTLTHLPLLLLEGPVPVLPLQSTHYLGVVVILSLDVVILREGGRKVAAVTLVPHCLAPGAEGLGVVGVLGAGVLGRPLPQEEVLSPDQGCLPLPVKPGQEPVPGGALVSDPCLSGSVMGPGELEVLGQLGDSPPNDPQVLGQ